MLPASHRRRGEFIVSDLGCVAKHIGLPIMARRLDGDMTDLCISLRVRLPVVAVEEASLAEEAKAALTNSRDATPPRRTRHRTEPEPQTKKAAHRKPDGMSRETTGS